MWTKDKNKTPHCAYREYVSDTPIKIFLLINTIHIQTDSSVFSVQYKIQYSHVSLMCMKYIYLQS